MDHPMAVSAERHHVGSWIGSVAGRHGCHGDLVVDLGVAIPTITVKLLEVEVADVAVPAVILNASDPVHPTSLVADGLMLDPLALRKAFKVVFLSIVVLAADE